MVKFILFFMSLLVSTNALSHTGHDHNNAMSGLIHIIWIAPLAVAAVLLGAYLKKRFFSVNDE